MQVIEQPTQAEDVTVSEEGVAVSEDVVALAAALLVAARTIQPVASAASTSQWATAARLEGVRG
jgi:hypothetical protein